ncbi:hypothetical protein F4604DRAFT_1676854 [Suillus subluteus]|nr:hypothetical protein F4604DRAFT_1676854 [Suillus subluteus]
MKPQPQARFSINTTYSLKDQLKHAHTCLHNKENIPLPQGTTLLHKLPQQVEVLKRQLAASNDKLVCTQDQLYQVREAHATTYTKAKHYQKDAARWKGTVKDKSDELTRAHADLEEKTTQLLTLRSRAIKAALSRNKQHTKNASVAKYFSVLDIIVDDALLNAMLDQPIKDQLELHCRLGEEKTIPKKSHLSICLRALPTTTDSKIIFPVRTMKLVTRLYAESPDGRVKSH